MNTTTISNQQKIACKELPCVTGKGGTPLTSCMAIDPAVLSDVAWDQNYQAHADILSASSWSTNCPHLAVLEKLNKKTLPVLL